MPVCKKRLIAMVRCEGGQCNAANAHGGCKRVGYERQMHNFANAD